MGGESKSHRKKKAGRKAEKRKSAESKKNASDADKDQSRKQNPKAFIFSSRGKAKIQRARTAEKDQRRVHVPAVERPVEEPPPFVILVHGPPGVGKTTLIKGLVKHYTRQDVREIKGPITVVAGKARRLTFMECPQDVSSMIDAAKFADLVLLLIDGSFGFEMETFEFLNILQVHGFPKVMGVLTHLDGFTDTKALKKTKKALKHRFWAEIYQGAKLFYLSGVRNGKYLKREVLNLARFVSVMKFRPLSWRLNHPYLVADRFEDLTPGSIIQADPRCDRDIAMYGYVRGNNWKEGITIHVAGVGDYRPTDVAALPDPCPLPNQLKKRALNERERLIYAPMSDVGGLLFDKDAMYIDVPDWKVQFSQPSAGVATAGGMPIGHQQQQQQNESGVGMTVDREYEGEAMVRGLQQTKLPVDEKLDRSRIQLFAGGDMVSAADVDDMIHRKKSADQVHDDDDDDDLDDDEEEELNGVLKRKKGYDVDIVHSADGRVRRRAIFPSSIDDALDDDALDDDALDDELDDNESDDDDELGDDDDDGLGNAATWKSSIRQRAAALFATRAVDLQDYIYGTPATASNNPTSHTTSHVTAMPPGGDNGDDDDGDFFRLRRPNGDSFSNTINSNNNSTAPLANSTLVTLNEADSSRSLIPSVVLDEWIDPGAVEGLRNRFVTGDWEQGKQRDASRPENEHDSDGGDDYDDVYGDFEDVETGDVFKGSDDPATRAAAAAIKAAATHTDDSDDDLAAKKAAKKAAFDAEYDEGGGGGKGVKDEVPGANPPAGKQQQQDGEEDAEETFYDAMKREMAERAQRTKAAMDALDPAQRVAMEGHRPGTYVRVRLSGIPWEMIESFDPATPLLLGGLSRGEEAPGYMQMRLKRHRWFPKTLKNKDPLIFSVGWRRFQSLPVFAIKDNNERHRMLKYAPEHMHCLAGVYGPLAPPGTGIMAIQKLDSTVSHWRIAATGVVLQLDASLRVVKKLKLVGTPFKIHRHTAFINGMFNSQLEAAKFEGASVRTVSGIRGTIKKAVRPGSQSGAHEGAFRATFEDKPLMSDVVFLRAWVLVDIPRFFNPVTNLLAPRATTSQRDPKPQRSRGQKAKTDDDGVRDDDDGRMMMMMIPGMDSHESHILEHREFIPSNKFKGKKAGFVFTKGERGVGYYQDVMDQVLDAIKKGGTKKKAQDTGRKGDTVTSGEADGGSGSGGSGLQKAGWVPMKSVADLRRELGVGAPRVSDSLYRHIERKPRKFNPLKVPASLQAALPFKSKPKLEAKRKRKTLEQRRAVVVEPEERKKMTLVSQLNAIRNAKAEARRAQKARYEERAAKKSEEEESWRSKYNKEQRKKRFVEQGMADKRKEKRARMHD